MLHSSYIHVLQLQNGHYTDATHMQSLMNLLPAINYPGPLGCESSTLSWSFNVHKMVAAAAGFEPGTFGL